MPKIRKTKVKYFGVIACAGVLSVGYLGLSFYSLPQQAHAAEIEEWRTLSNITYMQDMTVEICNNSEIGESKALIDRRGAGYTNDGVAHSYVVKKLSDDRCWMGQNLNLVDKKVTSADSNVVNDYKIPETRIWYPPLVNDYHQMIEGAYFNDNTSSGYYTWLTATAGTTGGGAVTQASYDICPKGWRLPTGTSRGEFQPLYDAGSLKVGDFTANSSSGYWLGGSTADAPGAAFFPATGYLNASQFADIGISGYYWSSSAVSETAYSRAYFMSFGRSFVNLDGYDYRYRGYSVRCMNNPDSHSTDAPDQYPTQSDTDISVQVGPTLTIDAAEGMSGQVDYTKVLEGSISATISSNLGYTVMLSAAKPALTNAINAENTITPVANTTILQKGITGWGIWTGEGTTTESKTYAPITTKATEYHSDTSAAADGIGTIHTFGVGIAVSPSIPNGTYSTVVTVTAANA